MSGSVKRCRALPCIWASPFCTKSTPFPPPFHPRRLLLFTLFQAAKPRWHAAIKGFEQFARNFFLDAFFGALEGQRLTPIPNCAFQNRLRRFRRAEPAVDLSKSFRTRAFARSVEARKTPPLYLPSRCAPVRTGAQRAHVTSCFLRENERKLFSKCGFCVLARCAPVRTGAQRFTYVRHCEMRGEVESRLRNSRG